VAFKLLLADEFWQRLIADAIAQIPVAVCFGLFDTGNRNGGFILVWRNVDDFITAIEQHESGIVDLLQTECPMLLRLTGHAILRNDKGHCRALICVIGGFKSPAINAHGFIAVKRVAEIGSKTMLYYCL
jgi:hypothetical protein